MQTKTRESKWRQYVASDIASLESDKRTVLNMLLGCRGSENAVSARELAEFTTCKPTTVRDMVIELRDDYNVPIASLPGKGYFLVESPEELAKVVEYYDGEIETKKERKQAIVKAYNTHRYE